MPTHARNATFGTETGCWLVENHYRASAPVGCIYAHGAGHLSDSILDGAGADKMAHVAVAIAEAGIPVLSMDFGGANTWGSTTATSKMANAVTALGNLGVTTTKVILLGTSMGALTCLNWAKDNASSVACFVGIVPVVNRDHVHDADLGSYATAIENAETAASTTYAATETTHDPNANKSSFTFPMKLYYGATDPIAVPDDVTAFASGVPSGSATSMAVAHDSSAAPAAEIAAYMQTHAT